MDNPLIQLNQWWEEAKADSPLHLKSAVCLSTINADGFPNSRFVDLREVTAKGVVFCTSFDSEKSRDITNNTKVGITAWWDHIGYQIRIIGNAIKLDANDAEKYWATRKPSAQIATHSFSQSDKIKNESELAILFSKTEKRFINQIIPKPENWGAYTVEPASLEFLQFKETRLHHREQYTRTDAGWTTYLLQP